MLLQSTRQEYMLGPTPPASSPWSLYVHCKMRAPWVCPGAFTRSCVGQGANPCSSGGLQTDRYRSLKCLYAGIYLLVFKRPNMSLKTAGLQFMNTCLCFYLYFPSCLLQGLNRSLCQVRIPVDATKRWPCPPCLDLCTRLSRKTGCFLVCWLDLGR